jgi:cytochrome b subunit of formate dehydrogenase
MRATFLILCLAAGSAVAAPSNKTCLVCHTSEISDAGALATSVHAKLGCADCHTGYDFSLHQARPAQPSAADAAQIAKLATKSSAPAALVACAKCHASQREDLLASTHGRWLGEDRPAAGPTCPECHGPVHQIQTATPATLLDKRKAIAARCAGCHEDAAFAARAKLVVHASFADTIHGRLLKLGNPRAPVCASCHGTHDVAPMSSPDSMVVGANKTQTCAECHKGANANFAATFTHVPPNKVNHKVPYYTAMVFSWIVSLVLTGLVIHLTMDAGSEFRLRWRRRKGKEPPEGHTPKGYVQRFDKNQLMQHWLMMISVFALLLSGWPLRAASIGTSSVLAGVLGGAKGASIVHRVAGALLGFVAAYHVVYISVQLVKKNKIHSMIPNWKDVTDVFQNLAFFLGLRKERPRFAHFMYIEKFEYLALSWGTFVIFVTGLVRWFPAKFAGWMPAKVIEFCQVVHGYEAMMAALVLLVWHLYNVHLKASIFPMSWVWIDGKIDYETLKEEHGAEYDELVAQGKIPRGEP